MQAKLIALPFIGLLWTLQSSYADEAWRSFEGLSQQYHIESPANFASRTEANSGHLMLSSGDVTIEVYGGVNLRGLTPRQFARELRKAGGMADITYQARGRTWLVISGHYQPMRSYPQPLIYYAKFSFSSDLSHLSGFEMSYPVSDKQRMDPIVAHIQKTFRGPITKKAPSTAFSSAKLQLPGARERFACKCV